MHACLCAFCLSSFGQFSLSSWFCLSSFFPSSLSSFFPSSNGPLGSVLATLGKFSQELPTELPTLAAAVVAQQVSLHSKCRCCILDCRHLLPPLLHSKCRCCTLDCRHLLPPLLHSKCRCCILDCRHLLHTRLPSLLHTTHPFT